MTHETLEIAGFQVRRGGSGPAVVYLHSALGDGDWLPWCDDLASDHTVIVPVLPGFGESDEMARDIDDLCFRLDQLLDALALERPVLMGQSLGGWMACEYAVRWPGKVGRLVLLDAAGLRIEGAVVADMWATRAPDLAELLFADQSHPLAMIMHAFDPEHPPPAEVLVPFFKAQQATARLAWNPYLHNPALPGRLSRIGCPALVLWGEADRFIPYAHGEAYANAIPNARLEQIPGAGHLPLLEQPDAVLKAVRTFLTG